MEISLLDDARDNPLSFDSPLWLSTASDVLCLDLQSMYTSSVNIETRLRPIANRAVNRILGRTMPGSMFAKRKRLRRKERPDINNWNLRAKDRMC